MPLNVSSTCAHHQEVKIALHSLRYHHTCRWPSGAQVERGLYNKFISCLYMFRAHVLIIRRSKLHYTASGMIPPVGGRPVQRLREDSTISLFHTSTCFEHMCSKHVEVWNILIVKQKFYASIWLTTEINILRCAASKPSKVASNAGEIFTTPYCHW